MANSLDDTVATDLDANETDLEEIIKLLGLDDISHNHISLTFIITVI